MKRKNISIRKFFFTAITAVMILFLFTSTAHTHRLFWIFYSEGRYIHDGPAVPGVSNYSDVAAFYSVYPDVSHEAGVEGRYRILKWPLSVGARFLWQDGSWRSESEDEFLLGPSLQLKWGSPNGEEIICNAETGKCRNTFWDLTLRHNLLVDLQEGDIGNAEFYAIFLKEFGVLTHFQLIPAVFLFYFGRDALPEYIQEDQVQLTTQIEGSLHWVAPPKKLVQPLLRLEYTHVWTPEVNDSRGVFTTATGVKGEVRVTSWMVFWWSVYGGIRAFTGDYQEDYGWLVGGSAGILFKK